MKRIIFFLAIVLPIVFVGCEQNNYMKLENQQQQAFDDFLAIKREASYRQNNDIQKKEYFNQFEKDLFNYIDSVGLFVNWKGWIDDLKTETSGNLTALMFTITYQPEQCRKVKFHCTHLFQTDSISNDHLYLTLKNTPNGWIVYFDGFIRTKNNDEVVYYMRSSGEDINIAYPNYKFFPVNINPEKGCDSLTISMRNAVSIAYKINQPLKKRYMGLITKNECDEQFNALLPSFKNAKSILSDNEKQYIKRLSSCLTYNYLYGK